MGNVNLDDKWFYTQLESNPFQSYAQKAFKEVHGPHKKPEITLEVLEKNSNTNHAKKCKAHLLNLSKITSPGYADLIRFCSIIYSNFCDEIFAGLDDFFYQSIIMEWMLHSDSSHQPGKRYRDHITHQLKVSALGISILNGESFGTPMVQHLVDALKTSPKLQPFLNKESIKPNQINDQIVYASWLLSSLFHDIGYCFLVQVKMNKHLGKVSNFFTGDFTNEIWQKVEPNIKEHSYLVEFYRDCGEGLSVDSTLDEIKAVIKKSAFEGKNHSVVGALYLIYMLSELEKRASSAFSSDGELLRRFRLVFELASLAVLTHDVDCSEKQVDDSEEAKRIFKQGTRITFDNYPLSYLLGVCDQLQDWGRRRTVRIPKRDHVVEEAIEDCSYVKLSLDENKKLDIRFGASRNVSQEVEASYWFFSKKLKINENKAKLLVAADLLQEYNNGRAYILNYVYGACPLWDKFALYVEAGSATFSVIDYFENLPSKQAIQKSLY